MVGMCPPSLESVDRHVLLLLCDNSPRPLNHLHLPRSNFDLNQGWPPNKAGFYEACSSAAYFFCFSPLSTFFPISISFFHNTFPLAVLT